MRRPTFDFLLVGLLALYPLLSFVLPRHEGLLSTIGAKCSLLFVTAILALALNLVVGSAGQLHLGISAYFGIGAYTAAILATTTYPFQLSGPWKTDAIDPVWLNFLGLLGVLMAAALVAALVSAVLSLPILRMRGDYLALVTLGFGEVFRFILINLNEVTDGTQGIRSLPDIQLPLFNGPDSFCGKIVRSVTGLTPEGNWRTEYRWFYYFNLLFLAIVLVLLRNVGKSRLGRAWIALREDELAASCMGLNTARLKLAAYTIGGGIAGFAGGLFCFYVGSVEPSEYSFQRSIIVLACVILGGLANRSGVLLGVMILYGYDLILSPIIDLEFQRMFENFDSPFMKFSNWRLMLFGFTLIFIMRFRPEGLLPASRMKRELHPETAGGS